MTAHADLAEVRAALAPVAKATSGPWRTFGRWPNLAVVSGHVRPRIVASLASASDAVDDTMPDAAAIVALRNAAPAISAAVEELTAARAEIARQRETIRAGADAVRSANASTTEIGGRLDAAGERIAALEADVAKRDAEIAALRRQVCRLTSGDEIEGDRLCQHHGADVAALALLADERAAHAATSRDLDALLTALGAQVTPGGQTEEARDARRVADGMRRARELAAAREVPADVEAAIVSLVEAARDLEVYAEGKVTAKRTKSAEAEFGRARTALRAAIAAEIERGLVSARARFDCARSVFFNDMLRRRNITSPCQECEGYGVLAYPSSATWRRGAGGQMSTYDVCDRCWGSGDAVKHGVDQRRLGAEIERARAEGRGEAAAAAAPATVGGLLATAPAGSVVEWMDDGSWYRYGDSLWVDYWSTFEGRWLPDDGPIWPSILRLPARLVPASEADADPASRGPIGGGS